MHFSEIIKLQVRKKSHSLLYILALFRDITTSFPGSLLSLGREEERPWERGWRYYCLVISEKCMVTPNFLFGF